MKTWILRAATAAVLGLMPMSLQAAIETTVTVTANQTVQFANQTLVDIQATVPGGAVMPPNAPSSSNYYSDAYDPDTLPAMVDLTGMGPILNISATGEWDSGQPGSTPSGADGNGIFSFTQGVYAEMGISLIGADLNTLVGVFTDDNGPNIGDVTPSPLFEGISDMTTPQLYQAFAINSLLNGIIVPTGATKLWLGLANSHAWTNGTGSLEVTIQSVPEPSSLIVWSLLGVAGAVRYRRRLLGNVQPA